MVNQALAYHIYRDIYQEMYFLEVVVPWQHVPCYLNNFDSKTCAIIFIKSYRRAKSSHKTAKSITEEQSLVIKL